MKAVIFDIDGTLCDLSHRKHYVTGTQHDWDSFFSKCGDDKPFEPVINLVRWIRQKDSLKVLLVSGRPEKTREVTTKWMHDHKVPFDVIYMRKDNDYRQDFIIKEEILNELQDKGYKIELVVDDRNTVVDMWRRRGITCLQCREWDEKRPAARVPVLSIMIGPSGAGKSFFLEKLVEEGSVHSSQIVSSDRIRLELCGDFRDQTKNEEVFEACHEIIQARLNNGLDTTFDATNLRRKDRVGVASLAKGGPVRYIVVDRPQEKKKRDGGWRLSLGFDLISKHSMTFNSQLKDILKGDNLPNVEVIDIREAT